LSCFYARIHCEGLKYVKNLTHRLHDTEYVPMVTGIGVELIAFKQMHSDAHSDLFKDTRIKVQIHVYIVSFDIYEIFFLRKLNLQHLIIVSFNFLTNHLKPL
jgi:hypothetical protein